MTTHAVLPERLRRQIATWRVDLIPIRQLTRLYDRQLYRRILNRIQRALPCQEEIEQLSVAVCRLLQDRDAPRRITPELVWLATCAADDAPIAAMLLKQTVETVNREAQCCERAGLQYLPSGTIPAWADYGIRTVERDLRAAGYPCHLAASARETTEMISHVESALQRINTFWPEAGTEVSLLLQTVVFVDGVGIRSATVPGTFGSVYLQAHPECPELDYFDWLLHETAHHSLMLRMAAVRYSNNSRQLATSPLRPDPRPLDAILHAVFVLVRVCWGLVLAQEDFSRSVRDAAAKRLRGYCNDLESGLTTLESTGLWTEEGNALLLNVREASHIIRAQTN